MLLLNLNNFKLEERIFHTCESCERWNNQDRLCSAHPLILTVQPTINHISETPAIPLKQSNEGGAETQITISNANHRGV